MSKRDLGSLVFLMDSQREPFHPPTSPATPAVEFQPATLRQPIRRLLAAPTRNISTSRHSGVSSYDHGERPTPSAHCRRVHWHVEELHPKTEESQDGTQDPTTGPTGPMRRRDVNSQSVSHQPAASPQRLALDGSGVGSWYLHVVLVVVLRGSREFWWGFKEVLPGSGYESR